MIDGKDGYLFFLNDLFRKSGEMLVRTLQNAGTGVEGYFSATCGEELATKYNLSSWYPDDYTRLRRTYAAFWETEGVMDLLHEARFFTYATWHTNAGKHHELYERRRELERDGELGTHSILRRIWKFVDFALRDAAFLGPPSERPSVALVARHIRLREKAEAEKEAACATQA